MSTPSMTSNGVREAVRPGVDAARPARPPRRRHTPGGATLGKEAGREAQRLAAAILEVLGGLRTPSQAAEVLGVTQSRYYQVETRALQALVAACEPRPRGRTRSADQELAGLRRQYERLQRELGRQQTLVRLTQRTLGLAPPPAPSKPGKDQGKDQGKGKKRRRRPVVRALRAAEVLERHRQEAGQQEAARAAATPPDQEEP